MRIDFLRCKERTDTFEAHMLGQIAKTLTKWNIPFRIQNAFGDQFRGYLQEVVDEPPFCVISFSDPFPLQNQFFEKIGIKHFYWNQHSDAEAIDFLTHPGAHTHAFCPERKESQRCFLPSWCLEQMEQSTNRPFDFVLFDPLVDVDYLIETWEDALKQCLEKCLENPTEHPFSFMQKPSGRHLKAIEEALFAIRIRDLVESITEGEIHLFGEHIGNNWYKRLKNGALVHLHWKIPYEHHFEVLRHTKVLLREQLPYHQGADPWVLPALSLGALPLTRKTAYLSNLLEDALFFESKIVQPCNREELVKRLQKKIEKTHPFENTLKALLEHLSYAH